MLLGVGGVLYLATGLQKDRLKFCINDERRLSTILVLVKFDLRLFGAWRRKNMKSSPVQSSLCRARIS